MTRTRGPAKELGPKIQVDSVCPRLIDTDFQIVFTKPLVRTHVAIFAPLKRKGAPKDIANPVAFLASDDAAFVTAANIEFNGSTHFS